MPLGPYSDFESCVSGIMQKQDVSEESARRICGAMQRDLEGSIHVREAFSSWESCMDKMLERYDEETAAKVCGSLRAEGFASVAPTTAANHVHDRDGRFVAHGAPRVVEKFTNAKDKYFVRAFLIDPSLNLNKWRVTESSIARNINTFVGRPLVLTKDFEHPGADMDSLNHWLDYQEDFRVGTITDIVPKKTDTGSTAYHAIIEVTNKDLEAKIRSNEVPIYVSPAIAEPIHIGSEGSPPDVAIEEWTGIHLAIVSNPAYGIRRARITETCGGDRAGCLAILKKAQHVEGCGFCVKEAMQRYTLRVASQTSTSHGLKTSANHSKSMSTLESMDSTQAPIPKVEEQPAVVEKVEQSPALVNSKQPVSVPKVTSLSEALSENQELRHQLQLAHLKISELTDANNTVVERLGALELESRREKIERIVTPDVIRDDKARLEKIKSLTSSSIPLKDIEDLYKDIKVTLKKASVTGGGRNNTARVPYLTSSSLGAGSVVSSGRLDQGPAVDEDGLTPLQKQMAVLRGGF